jgi:AcrR family transcriptional regulator
MSLARLARPPVNLQCDRLDQADVSSHWPGLPRIAGIVDPRTLSIIFLGRRERYLIEAAMSEPEQMKSLKRGRGRPKSFDRTAAIQQAMELFWDRGYEGTTFDDLIGAMKLSPSSFYHEFGSKERLYREAADYYFNMSTSCLRGFATHPDARAAFEALIEEAAAFFTNNTFPAGCMISLAGHTASAAFTVCGRTHQKFAQAFGAGVGQAAVKGSFRR